ncbi:hypothetical protein VOLCADRAFT_104003 [Volvox carteri f. nagariensis]|uniref:Uncharacterized protein n=1 Tax=Volvox carteri f. nagariensis TaxID=3068 RepID=D8TQK6_VOLCA|nr:uncharacterized protein VOLCADRAFT_104003 [Volvox carteri f. nagariensis]EFJ50051.1 hypothetical protein VOLCADRAFT_104003 [Volvox carteri f. nagariensis]|eukprot:XP_002948671.1 hypothetical protein VOLCADRAFT_104003 [Volvox carteri f. nagariensis]
MLKQCRLHYNPFSHDHIRLSTRPTSGRCRTRFIPVPVHTIQHVQAFYDRSVPKTSKRRVVKASSGASASTPPTQPIIIDIPGSQQEAVLTAVQCLVPALQPHLASLKTAKTSKGFSYASKGGNTANRFGVEIPVLDTSPQAAVDLANLVLSATAARVQQRSGAAAAAAVAPANWTLVHAREDAVQVARSSDGTQVLGLRQACRQTQLGGLLLVVEPSISDVALVEQLLDDVWVGPAAVVLNPQWSQQGAVLPAEYQRVAESIAVVYSFLPCAIQGLLGPKEGAVLRMVESRAGAEGSPPWRILLKERDQFVQVGAMARRPTSSDLELAFINAAAASSPLTKTAKFLRGLIPGKKT